MFGSRNIDFEWIDYVKLILAKTKMKVKWFMFGYIQVKVSWTLNFERKNQFLNQKLQFLA
jgi:hypothetical protein